jgi:hypothetical protein
MVRELARRVISKAEPSGGATARAAALARATQVKRRMAELLLRADVPVDVRTGEFAQDKSAAYCAKMSEIAEPLIASYEESMAACHAAAEAAGAGWWTSVC